MPTTQPFDWSRLLQPFLQAGAQAGANQLFGLQPRGIQLGGLTVPNSLAGAGLLTGGALLDREPGEVAEARQFLRNRFTSPNALSQQFAGQIGGLAEQYQPLLAQQRQRGIADIQQKFIAAFPKTVGAQGPEFGTLARYITDEALPREQAVLGDVGRQLLTEQGRAAETILNTNKPDPFASALSQFGGLLMARDLLGAGQGQLGPGGTQLLGRDGQVIGTVGQDGQLLQAGATALGNGLFAVGGNRAGEGRLVVDATGNVVGAVGADGSIVGTNGQVLGTVSGAAGQRVLGGLATRTAAGGLDFGVSGPGLLGPPGLSSAAGIGSGVAIAGIGYKIGRAMGSQIDQPGTQFGDVAKYATPLGLSSNEGIQAAGSGAVTGAATGFALGGPVGAVVGAIAGAIGGFTGERSARHERKEGQSEAEAQQTGAQRPAALQQFNGTLSSLDQLATQLSQLPQANGDVILSLMAQDPAFDSLVREQSAIIGRALSASHRVDMPKGIMPPEGMAAAIRGLRTNIASGPPGESILDLIQSSETGRFGPGVELLQRYQTNVQTANQAMSVILDAMRQKGVQV